MSVTTVKAAAIKDCWNHLSVSKGFRNKIKKITIKNVNIYDDVAVDISSALVSICGRNGIGKTSLLKMLYKILSKDSCNTGLFESIDIDGVTIEMEINGKNQVFSLAQESKLNNVEYFDPSTLALKIIDEIKLSPEKNGWFNTSTPYTYEDEILFFIRRITGKKYECVRVHEVEGILDDVIFPYFEVKEKGAENFYSSEQMGQGEHKLLIAIWKLKYIEKNSVIFIEEPETFICPSSQNMLMDFFAYMIDDKKINIIMATHSEHILNQQGLNSVLVLDKKSKKYSLSRCKDNYEYFSALRLNPERKNIFLVEDKFAKLVLEYILKISDIYLYATSYIHVLGGESNIKKVMEHYKEHSGLNIVAVFDADQAKDNSINSICINKVFLPSINGLPPEQEVIACLKESIEEYAKKIDYPSDELEESILSLNCDHHDFFIELSDRLNNKLLSILKDAAIQIWLNKHSKKINLFVYCLRNINNEVAINLKLKETSEDYRYAEILDGPFIFKVNKKFDSFAVGEYLSILEHDATLGEIVVNEIIK